MPELHGDVTCRLEQFGTIDGARNTLIGLTQRRIGILQPDNLILCCYPF
jgi:hypothetical protein